MDGKGKVRKGREGRYRREGERKGGKIEKGRGGREGEEKKRKGRARGGKGKGGHSLEGLKTTE